MAYISTVICVIGIFIPPFGWVNGVSAIGAMAGISLIWGNRRCD